MDGAIRSVRSIAIAGVVLLTIACGVLLVYRLVTPESVRAVRTSSLVAILAVFALPAASLTGLAIDRWALRRGPRARMPAMPERRDPPRSAEAAPRPVRGRRRGVRMHSARAEHWRS
ncbi:MAG: hypothetical protein IT439_11530 [Phycisphaerales bacterium]|nr:hypothetical protein [Phycisphaerales bacterium]